MNLIFAVFFLTRRPRVRRAGLGPIVAHIHKGPLPDARFWHNRRGRDFFDSFVPTSRLLVFISGRYSFILENQTNSLAIKNRLQLYGRSGELYWTGLMERPSLNREHDQPFFGNVEMSTPFLFPVEA
jgi:hypothetical protein